MKTHLRGAALQQFASEGEVASSLVLSYTLVPVQEEEGNAPDVSSVVYSPQVGTALTVVAISARIDNAAFILVNNR